MKLTESQLRAIIKKEINEMNMGDVALNVSHFGGFMYGIDVIGTIALILLATSVITYDKIKDQINKLNISNEKKQAAFKVAELVEKHKGNKELVELVKNGKLKEFASKLKELEGGSVDRTTSRSVYKGLKGIP